VINKKIKMIGYLIAAVSLLVNLVLYYLKDKSEKELFEIKQKYEDEKGLRDKRYSVYKEYLTKLDTVNSTLYLNQNSEKMKQKVTEVFEQIKSNPNNLEKYFNLMKEQFDLIIDWMRENNKLLDEINAVKLVGSEKVFNILEDYQRITKESLEATAKFTFEVAFLGPGNFSLEAMMNYSQRYEELQTIKRELEKAMREDIGIL
jgi:Txe/YoeB family toxin of Txe-Axe toxin-antitoxin module